MIKDDKLQGFYTPPPKRNSRPPKTWMSEQPIKNRHPHHFHILHKVPSGHSPYVKAKHVQLIEKDPSKAVALFWNAINAGDRVDSALKDMAVVMKQLDRSNEAIEAIKSFRHLCSFDSQESLDNVLLELYKRSGRLEEQIEVIQLKLKRLEEGNTFGGRRVKVAKSQGKKIHITVEQEYARLLGNLAWAYLQQNDYKTAEEYYRKALSLEADKNKQCNLAICLMCMNRLTEAKFLLQVIRASVPQGEMDESYAKSFERAFELFTELESQQDKSSSFEAEKENRCGNVKLLQKKPLRNSNTSVSDNQFDLDDKKTYTPSVEGRGILKSPFTQPKRSFSVDNGNWKKGTYRDDEAVSSCLPRRLQFENPADSTNLISKYLPVDSTPDRNVPDKKAPDAVDRKETDGVTSNNWDFTSFKSQKSWADIAEEEEEEEEEMMPPLPGMKSCEKEFSIKLQSLSFNEDAEKQSPALFFNQQKQQEPLKSNRLQVFRDLTPE